MIITPFILTDISVSQEMWCLITTYSLRKSKEGFSLISVHRLAFGKKQIDDRNWLSHFSLLSKRSTKIPVSVKFYSYFPFLTNIFLKYLPRGHVCLCIVSPIALPLIQIFMLLLSTSGCSHLWDLRLVQRSHMLNPVACVVSIAYCLYWTVCTCVKPVYSHNK